MTTNTPHYPATLNDAAAELGITATTVRYYVLRGVCTPNQDSSGRWLFLPQHIDLIRTYRQRTYRRRLDKK